MKIKERLITVSDILTVLRRYFLLIIAAAVVFGAAGYLYAVKTTTVTYEASSGVYVQMADVDMEVGPTSTQISLARAMAASCKNAIRSEAVYQNAKAYFAEQRKTDSKWEDISSMSNDKLRSMVECTVESNSQYVTITVTASTASMAVHLANAIAGVLEVSVVDVIGNCRIDPTTVARGATATSDFSPTLALTLAVVGAFLAFCGMFAVYFFNPRVRISDINTCYQGVSLVGDLYTARKKKKTDAVPALRANLLSRLAEASSSVLLLSPVSERTAADLLPHALAASFADTGRRVLLVNGMTHDNVPHGLADAVAGKAEAIRSATKNLDCVSFGDREAATADLLGSRAFAAFLSEARAKYDLVLLCTPPVSSTADAATAAPLADGVLVAVTPGKDMRASLSNALLTLSAVDAKLLGAVAAGQ